MSYAERRDLSCIIKLTWDEHDGHVSWVNFACWSVVGYSGSTLYFRDDDPTRDNGGFATDRESVPPDFSGYVKWDGCNEWDYNHTHKCDGIESLRDQHAAEEACLRFAHAVMMRGERPHVEWDVPE